MTLAASAASPTRVTSGGQRAPLTFIPDRDPAVRVAFTGRVLDDGVSGNLSLLVGDGDVAGVRDTALAVVGATADRAVFMQQVHGGGVAEVDSADAGAGARDHATAVPGVDAIVTRDEDLALVVLVADCVPVILVDPGRSVAAVHAGRGGVAANVVAAALGRMAGRPSQMVALIGPAIGGCCYEVPADMAARVGAAWPDAGSSTTWGTPSLDLPSAVVAQLRACGVGSIERLGGCTRCSGDVWFSHRAAGAGVAPHGRQAGIVVRASTGTWAGERL